MSSTDITSSPAAAGAPDAERPGPPLSDARTRARRPGARTGAALLRRPGTVLAGLFVLLMIGWVLFRGCSPPPTRRRSSGTPWPPRAGSTGSARI